jgi:hypothetical protein
MPEFPTDLSRSTLTVATSYPPAPDGGPLLPGDSEYVEIVYAGILGPSATLLYRRLYRELVGISGDVEISIHELALSLGCKPTVTLKGISRLDDFHFARWTGQVLLVNMTVRPVTPRVLARLSTSAVWFHVRTMRALETAS